MNSSRSAIPPLLIFTSVFVYLILRSILVPLVHDEAETFFIYMVNGHYLPFQGYTSANNHFINSFLGHLCFNLFGASTFSIRLPNLLFFPVYFFFCLKICRFLSNGFLRIASLLALTTTPFLLEFFALARGYGMGLALMTASLYFLLKYLKDRKIKNYLSTQLFSLLAILGSLTTFHVLLITILVFALVLSQEYRDGRMKDRWLKFTSAIVLMIVPAIFFVYYVIYLGRINELVVGSLDGFYEVTLAPLVGLISMSGTRLTVWLFMLVFLCIVILALNLWRKKGFKRALHLPEFVFPLFLVISLANIAIDGYLFEIPFPRDRAALFLFPLFVFSLAFSVDRAIPGSIPTAIGTACFIYFPVTLLATMNLKYSMYWSEKRIPDVYYDYILNHSRDAELATIGSMSLRESVWYHKIFCHPEKLNPLFINDYQTDLTTDFKIQPTVENPAISEFYKLVYRDAESGNDLYERIHKLERKVIFEWNNPGFKTNGLYLNLVEWDVPDGPGIREIDLIFEAEIKLVAASIPIEFSLILDGVDEGGKALISEPIRLSRIKYDWSKDEITKVIYTIGKIPQSCRKIILFILNNNESEYELKHGSFKLYKLVGE